MGEHSELTARQWGIGRVDALESHQRAVAAQERGFFADLIVPVDGVTHDAFPRKTSSLEALARLPPAFPGADGRGTATAANSSPLTDGAAAVWVASEQGQNRLPASTPRARLIDFELGAVDIKREGLLMAPAYVALWEIHEAFAGQVLYQLKALESPSFLKNNVKLDEQLESVPRERINPNGGSVALGHPFGATGARILSQAIKELAVMPSGSKAIVSICADEGVGTVALLEA